MSKSVYSVVLMDDVVDAVDRLAYEAGTNRSNMINRILAEYVQLATPEQRMQDIFSSIMDAVSGQNALQLMLNASDAMLSMRSAIHYKYNPSMRYVVELYPHSTEELGEVRAGLRTQNPSLLLYIGQFYKLWAGLERAYLEGPPRRSEAQGGRFGRKRKCGKRAVYPPPASAPECRRQRGGWPRYCGLCGAVRLLPENFF